LLTEGAGKFQFSVFAVNVRLLHAVRKLFLQPADTRYI